MLMASPSVGRHSSAKKCSSWLVPTQIRVDGNPAEKSRTALALDDDTPVEWSEEDVVFLHWRLLQGLNSLSDPRTPLEEKIDTLRWVFTDPAHDARPFSFVNCLKVVGCSPLSPTPYVGVVDPQVIRRWIRHHLHGWFESTLKTFPEWVRTAIVENPAWVANRLERNPQWLNQQIKARRDQGDLFV